MTKAHRPWAAPIALGAKDHAQEPHTPTLLLQVLTPAALFAKGIKSVVSLFDVPSTSARSLQNPSSEHRVTLLRPNL
jgi:hypothetical protein